MDFLYNIQWKGSDTMKISTRGRYAIRILLDIALHQGDGFVAMKDVARRQQISKKYGDQLGMQLSQAGLLLATRGRQGGYRLIPKARDVTALQVLKTMEGPLAPVQCLEAGPDFCQRSGFCLTLPLWQGLDKAMVDYLGGVTLQSLLDQAPPQPELEDMPVPD